MDAPLRNEFAVLHFDASDEQQLDVELLTFEVEESLSSCFRIVAHFLSASPALPFDDIVGRGAALSLQSAHLGERVWAGICTELELVNAEEHTGGPAAAAAMAQLGIGGPSYKGRSRYRMTIRPDLWRLSLRRNFRIFQHQTAPEIVTELLEDWEIEVEARLTEAHPTYEYRVQHDETDLDFCCRILEEAGITFWVMPNPQVPVEEKKKGLELTRVVLEDTPNNKKPAYDENNVLLYMGDHPKGHHDQVPHVWTLSATQQSRPQAFTIRGRDFRGSPDQDPQGKVKLAEESRKGSEGKYEQYSYEPGAFWAEKQPGGDTPVADDQGVARVDPREVERIPERRYHADLAGRTTIRFQTNALDLEPGTVFAIGKEEYGFEYNHAHPAFSPARKMMVVGRRIAGREHGSGYTSECVAVFADVPFRPARVTPKPRVFGLESAVVVGPKGKQIYTDEFGRVRVQFPWDRYHEFNERSSCWLRVSHPWAGGGFGAVAIPRVGHEVLVAFFEGDPDQPIIVGSVYNATTKLPYFPATGKDGLGDNATKTGLRTDSSPHTGGQKLGYNELLFQDQSGAERIHLQAQKDLSFVVNATETHDVGSAVAHKIGGTETHDVGALFDLKVGGAKGGPSTELRMTPTEIVLTTGDASIKLAGGMISIEAKSEIHIHATANVHLSSKTLVDVDAKKMTIDTDGDSSLLLNCGSPQLHDANAHPAGKAGGPRHGEPSRAPFLPAGGGPKPEAPGGLDHVNVGSDPEPPPPAHLDEDEGPDTSRVGAPPARAGELPLTTAAAAGAGSTFFPGSTFVPGASAPPNLDALSPGEQQALTRSWWGAEMTPATLRQDFAASVVPTGSGAHDLANMVLAHADKGFVERVGAQLTQAAVVELLGSKGIPAPAGMAVSAGLQQALAAAGEPGQAALTQAFFGGAVDQLSQTIEGKLGAGAFAALIGGR
jgi:type VI secretion system secreted protein VgrG